MLRQRIEQLKHEYTDQYVVVDGNRPELARFRGMTGRVKTINSSGRALVQFDAAGNAGWYDIALDFVKVVDKPDPKPAAPAGQAATAANPPATKPIPAAEPAAEPRPSPLELARQEKEEQKEKTEAATDPAAEKEEKAGPSSPEPAPGKKPPGKAEPAADVVQKEKLSALELARMEKEPQPAARAGPEEAASPAEPAAAGTTDGGGPSQQPAGQTGPGRSNRN